MKRRPVGLEPRAPTIWPGKNEYDEREKEGNTGSLEPEARRDAIDTFSKGSIPSSSNPSLCRGVIAWGSKTYQ